MGDQAQVTSVEALELFRTNLIIFSTKAKARLDEVGDEVRRTRAWVQNDRRLFWESETRKRQKALDQANQELLSARISNLRDNLSGQTTAVRKAQRALDEAAEKLKNVKTWTRNYDGTVEPLMKRLQGLKRILEDDMPKASATLVQIQNVLQAYSDTTPPAGLPTEGASSEQTQP